ncbi:ABC transporter substrate-binding protein [Halorubrum luteum]
MVMSDNTTQLGRRSFVKLAGAGAASVAIAGCAGSPDDDDDAAGTGTGGGYMDNHFVLIEDQTHGSMDPHAMSDTIENTMVHLLYDQLLILDPDTNEVEENIVTDWEVNEEGTVWEFTIREDITTHGGNTLTAEDVAYSMDRQLNISGGYGAFWQPHLNEGDTEAVSDTEVQITFDEAYGPFLQSLIRFSIVDKAMVEEHENGGDWASDWFEEGNTAGTGPYTIEEFRSSDTTNLVAHEDYWKGWDDDQFGTVDVEIIEESSTGMQSMQLGEADCYNGNLTDDNWEELAGFDGVEIVQDTMNRLYTVHMNTQKEPFTDIKVREAFFYAINYETIVENIIGSGLVAAGPIPRPLEPFHNEDIPVSEQDASRAQEALDDSGYTADEINELDVEIQPMAGNPIFEQTALSMQDNLNEVLGVEIDVNSTQWATIAEAYGSPDSSPHMFNTYNSANFVDAETHAGFMFHPDSFGTYATGHWYEDEEIIDLIERAGREPDVDRRVELYHEYQELIYEAYTNFWIANPDNRMGLQEHVGGYTFPDLISNRNIYNWYLDE